MGYLPNDVLSLCHWSELLQILGGLVLTVLRTGEVHPTLKRLIGIVSSGTQGCTDCTALSSYGANQLGGDSEKSPRCLSLRLHRCLQMRSVWCLELPGTGHFSPMQSRMKIFRR